MNTTDSGKTYRKPYYGHTTAIFGATFRSKLEAEWAAFFTMAGIRWEYEPHKVNTRHGGYIPDFILTDIHGGLICEVKPLGRHDEDANVTEQKLHDACVELKKSGTILRGNPLQFCVQDSADIGASIIGGSHAMIFAPDETGQTGWDAPYQFCVCPYCWKAGYEFDGRGARICKGGCGSRNVIDARNFDFIDHGDKGYSSDHPRIRLAAKTASEIVWQETR